LTWLAVTSVRRLLRRRALPGQALAMGWLVAYSSVGGVTNLLAFFVGFQLFRATNRVAIFISALVLVFLVVRLSRLTARWPAVWRLGAALVVTIIGLLDQLPRPAPAERQRTIAREVRADLDFGRQLEAALPDGAMVFQLPVMGFPEVVPPHRIADYEHFRAYLTTQDLHFSYGAAKYRSRSRWQRDLEFASTETLVRRLESYGFAALYLNRKGFEDRAEKILQELAALGYPETLRGEQGNQVVVRLNPSRQPKKPLGRTFTHGRGWQLRPEGNTRWGEDVTVLSYYNPYGVPLQAEAQLELVGVSSQEVIVELGDIEVGRGRIAPQPSTLMLALELKPGVNIFRLKTSEPARRRGQGRNQLRAVGMRSATIQIVSALPAAD
jgi:hypothetical protein